MQPTKTVQVDSCVKRYSTATPGLRNLSRNLATVQVITPLRRSEEKLEKRKPENPNAQEATPTHKLLDTLALALALDPSCSCSADGRP